MSKSSKRYLKKAFNKAQKTHFGKGTPAGDRWLSYLLRDSDVSIPQFHAYGQFCELLSYYQSKHKPGELYVMDCVAYPSLTLQL